MCPNDKSLPLRPELPEERPHPASQPRPPFCLFPSTSPEMPLENTSAPQKSPAYYQNMRAPPRPRKTRDQSPRSMPSTKGSLTSPRLASNRPWRHSLDHDFLL